MNKHTMTFKLDEGTLSYFDQLKEREERRMKDVVEGSKFFAVLLPVLAILFKIFDIISGSVSKAEPVVDAFLDL